MRPAYVCGTCVSPALSSQGPYRSCGSQAEGSFCITVWSVQRAGDLLCAECSVQETYCVQRAGDPSILRCRVLCGCKHNVVSVCQAP